MSDRPAIDVSNLSVLGKGAYGSVYKIDDTTVLKDMLCTKKDIEKETSIFLALSHCHDSIAKIYDINFVGNKRCQMVMEYIHGYDLSVVLASNRNISIYDRKLIMTHLLEGLSCIHDADVYHRDIKLENIMFTDNDRIKYIDFGLGCLFPSCKLDPTEPVGTDVYFSPELARFWNLENVVTGAKSFDYSDPDIVSEVLAAADVWALGVVFLELSIGSPMEDPLYEADQYDNYLKLLYEKYPKHSRVFGVIKRMLQIDFRQRPLAAEALQMLL